VAFVRIVPGVEAVAETNVVPVEMDVAGQQFQAAIGNTRGDGIATLNGNPVIVAGRAPSAPDEFAVNEAAVAGFPLGTTVTAQHLRLVGIARFPVDFAVAENKLQQTTGIAFTSLACWQMWGSRVGTAGSGWLPPRPGAGSALAARPIGVHRATLEGWSHAAPANRVPYVVAREAWPGRRRVASVMAPTTKGTAGEVDAGWSPVWRRDDRRVDPRRRRGAMAPRDIAVLRTLGFTPRQASWAVLWEAVAHAVAAACHRRPLGVALGRWGWNLLAEQIGTRAAPATPLEIAPAVGAAMLAVALVAAGRPGHRASRVVPALALPTE
jgi:hypothetical protein